MGDEDFWRFGQGEIPSYGDSSGLPPERVAEAARPGIVRVPEGGRAVGFDLTVPLAWIAHLETTEVAYSTELSLGSRVAQIVPAMYTQIHQNGQPDATASESNAREQFPTSLVSRCAIQARATRLPGPPRRRRANQYPVV